MTETVERITQEVRRLDSTQLAELLNWLADYETTMEDSWDKEIAADSQPGGRLDAVISRAKRDIAEGRTRPLDDVLGDS